MIKYLGTHNSGTSSKLVWWQRPFGYLLNLTSRCQNLSVEDQLKNFVRIFNIQVTYYKNEWVFSHGMCIYTGKMYDAISKMVQYATPESPVYFQLFLDKNFLLGQNKEEFRKMVDDLNDELKGTNVHMLYAYIEGTNEYPYKSNIKLNASEHYWTTSWAANNAKSWIDKLPLPKRHAKIYNDKYVEENKADYLMLDFIEIGKHFIEIGNHFINVGNKTTTTSKKPVTTTTSKKPITTTTSRLPVTTTTTWRPTTTTSKYPITTTTSNMPVYHTWPPVLFKSSDGKEKTDVSIIGICGKETITIKQLPSTTSFTYDSNEKVTFTCDNRGTLYYRKKDSTTAVKVGNKEFTSDELYNLVIIYKEKPVVTTTTLKPTTTTSSVIPTPIYIPQVPTTTTTSRYPVTTTTTWFPITTTYIPLCLNIHFNGNNYVYKHDDYRIWTDGKRFSLIFDGYFVQSLDESFNISHDDSLINVNTEIVPDGGYAGCLCITGDICGASYMHNIYLNINTTTTQNPTITTTDCGRLQFELDNKKYIFKSGYNFTITINKGQSKTIMFDTINGYPSPNNMIALSDNSKIALSSLSIFYRNITISGVNVGQTSIRIATTYRDAYYEGYINVRVIDVPTTTTTIYDNNSYGGNLHPTTTTTYSLLF